MINNVKPTSYQKWTSELKLGEALDWERMFIRQLKITKDCNLQWMQYRLMHRILGTNSLLLKMHLSETDLCSFCNEEKETLLHLFWECPMTNSFWADVFNLMSEYSLLYNPYRNVSDIILGKGESHLVNLIILIAKRYIYSAKMNKSIPYLSVFKKNLELQFKVEQKIAYMTNQEETFIQTWYLLQNMIGITPSN